MSLTSHLIVVLFSIVFVKCDCDVQCSFKKAMLVPQVIPEAPEKILYVTYGDREVKLGTDLKVTDTLKEPKVTWDADPDTLYTLVMFDPDVPFPQASLPNTLLHWLVGNIVGHDVDSGDVIAAYLAPTPPPLSDPHRYTFVLYKQNDREDFAHLSTLVRVSFNLSQFSDKHLEGPLFGNFFLEKSLKVNLF